MSKILTNAHRYDWSDWLEGIMRSVIGGGASGVLSGLVSMGVNPTTFNLVPGHGLAATLVMMGTMFAAWAAGEGSRYSWC